MFVRKHVVPKLITYQCQAYNFCKYEYYQYIIQQITTVQEVFLQNLDKPCHLGVKYALLKIAISK